MSRRTARPSEVTCRKQFEAAQLRRRKWVHEILGTPTCTGQTVERFGRNS